MSGEDERYADGTGQGDLAIGLIEVAGQPLQVWPMVAAGHHPGCTVVSGEVDEGNDRRCAQVRSSSQPGQRIGVKFLGTEAGVGTPVGGVSQCVWSVDDGRDDRIQVGHQLGRFGDPVNYVDQTSRATVRLVANPGVARRSLDHLLTPVEN
jgi:hypothetical protein